MCVTYEQIVCNEVYFCHEGNDRLQSFDICNVSVIADFTLQTPYIVIVVSTLTYSGYIGMAFVLEASCNDTFLWFYSVTSVKCWDSALK
jgi:hypothetical protein